MVQHLKIHMQFQESLRAQFWSSRFSSTHSQWSILSWHSYRFECRCILLYHTISSNSDYLYLQSDANTVQDWVNCNHMFLNPSNYKFMLISRKLNRINNPPAITIHGQTLETVPMFKYLGLLLSSDLSWAKHVEGICTKAKEILGLLYRQF